MNRKINDDDQKGLDAIHVIDGEKRQIEKLASRRKLKRSYEVICAVTCNKPTVDNQNSCCGLHTLHGDVAAVLNLVEPLSHMLCI